MNQAIFTGNLTRDPETKIMTNGKPRTTFTVAVTRPYTNTEGRRDADFIMITAYDKKAELCQKYLAKGRKVLTNTHVKTGSYEKDGKRIYTTEFVLDSIEFLSNKATETEEAMPQEQAEADDGFIPVDDDDLIE
ncbi:MAG: single-stranded DNA-binding protein [Christensenellales bacterium]